MPSRLVETRVGAARVGAAFRRHGTFVHDVAATIEHYGSAGQAIEAMRRAGMQHAWVRIHGIRPYEAPRRSVTRSFIDDLQSAAISVAGWGWCQGSDAKAEARLARRELRGYGLTDYLADIEQGVNKSHWTEREIRVFCTEFRGGGSGGAFGITTFPLIDWHAPELMRAALPYVDAFAPQVYWFNFPNRRMVNAFKRPDGSSYAPNDPAEYAELCLDRWDLLMGETTRPIVMTGQAYWGEARMTRTHAEAKLDAFLATWNSFDRIVGLNWWHLGGGPAMSEAMLESIVAADLDDKPYAGLATRPSV